VNTTELLKAVAKAAVNLDSARRNLVQVRDAEPEKWPKEMVSGAVPPSLSYRIRTDARKLLEGFVEPGLLFARAVSSLTRSKVEKEWREEREAAIHRAEIIAGVRPPEGAESSVSYVVAEVEAVMSSAEALLGKRPMTGEDRATLSKAALIQFVLLGEYDLESYIARALRNDDTSPDSPEDLSASIRATLKALSHSCLACSALLDRVSESGFDVGIDSNQLTGITKAIETLNRRVSVLESQEDA